MKRTMISLFALLILFSGIAAAQMAEAPEARDRQTDSHMGMMTRQMGQHPGMGMMGAMPGRGVDMAMMSGDGIPRGNRVQNRDTIEQYIAMRGRLALDDSQVEKLRQIRIDLVKTTGELETGLRVARLELQNLLDAETPEMKAIEKSINTIHESEAKLETARIRARLDAEKVLTPEQREMVQAGMRSRGMMRNMPSTRN